MARARRRVEVGGGRERCQGAPAQDGGLPGQDRGLWCSPRRLGVVVANGGARWRRSGDEAVQHDAHPCHGGSLGAQEGTGARDWRMDHRARRIDNEVACRPSWGIDEIRAN